jgi:catechol 2,3-dioxygenase
MGLQVLERNGPDAILGAAGRPLLLLREQPGALPWMTDNMTGLYHYAILVPTRADLGRWLRQYLTKGYPPPGQGDHIVSEALYLRDVDGHGIEVYADRPRQGWRWVNGQIQMGTGPVDIRGLFAEANREGTPWTGMPAGTTMGHVHLQVGSIPEAEAFYHGILGFDVVASMPSALFVSAGGYHHHLGLNTWHSQGASPAPDDTARLHFYSLALPNPEALAAVVRRLANAGVPYRETENAVVLQDPWQNTLLLHVGPVTDAERATALATASG